jgi:pimeloyl-ACP methyl ester carboxylesterase
VPTLQLPDGAFLYWEERGAGPAVVMATQFFGYPEVFSGVISDLARDHRVVTYDIRGAGRSTAEGPYDMGTDAADLAAVIEAVGGPAVVIGMGDGANRGVRAALMRPELVLAVLTPGGNPVGRRAARDTEALVNSPSVLQALLGLMETDYRSALRTMVESANPQMTEAEARERVDRVVAYCPQDIGARRLREWIEQDGLEESRAVGDRLWILSHASTAWFPAAALDHTRELLPEAHIEEVEDGPVSRPDLVAAVVRRITSEAERTGAQGATSTRGSPSSPVLP